MLFELLLLCFTFLSHLTLLSQFTSFKLVQLLNIFSNYYCCINKIPDFVVLPTRRFIAKALFSWENISENVTNYGNHTVLNLHSKGDRSLYFAKLLCGTLDLLYSRIVFALFIKELNLNICYSCVQVVVGESNRSIRQHRRLLRVEDRQRASVWNSLYRPKDKRPHFLCINFKFCFVFEGEAKIG